MQAFQPAPDLALLEQQIETLPAADKPQQAEALVRALLTAQAATLRIWHLLIPVQRRYGNNGGWRWMHGRDDSPCYPSVRLFRQPKKDDGASVVNRAADELVLIRKPTQDEENHPFQE